MPDVAWASIGSQIPDPIEETVRGRQRLSRLRQVVGANGLPLPIYWLLSAPCLDSFREFTDRLAPGSMGNFVADGDDNGDGPLDDLEQRHHCEPGVPGQVLRSVRLSNRRVARLGTPTFHAAYDRDTPVRRLRRQGGRRQRDLASRRGHVAQTITGLAASWGRPHASWIRLDGVA
jgi:hypothetical protein